MAKTLHETLGDNVVPLNYAIAIEPNFDNFKFKGAETISVMIRRITSSIALNSAEIKIRDVSIYYNGTWIDTDFTYEKEAERVVLRPATPVSGEAKIRIGYEGVHNDRLYGFYRSRYVVGGRTGFLMTTHMEPSKARTVFPCFDEPALKATFDASLLVDKSIEAISNMPIQSVKKGKNGKKLVKFATTPRMSTYLLYLGAGKFQFLKGKVGRIGLRVATAPGSIRYARIPLQYAKRLLPDLEQYFGIKYPLPKLDLVALPDFAVGAMENWGAITFRETALLGKEGETSVAGKQRIAEVTSHEMAHQWFGNMVTMEWWDDIWLNESFATLMEYMCVDRVFPEWKSMLKYYGDTIGVALSADETENTHPISVHVDTPDQINELFDNIGYEKGGSVLYMLANYVGHDRFRRGLSRYLRTHAYGNATREDLWISVQHDAGGVRVVDTMSDWITKAGYPIITVKKATNGFELEQERFTISGKRHIGTWKIPVKYLDAQGEGHIVMEGRKTLIRSKSEWIKLNYGQTGFYRVAYEKGNLEHLGMMISNGMMDNRDSWGVENDMFILARCGRITLAEYIGFVSRHCMHVGYPANIGISSHLNWFVRQCMGKDFAQGVKKLSIGFHRRILDRVGWSVKKGEGTADTILRSAAISALGLAGDGDVIIKATGMFKLSAAGRRKIDTDIKLQVYGIAAFNISGGRSLKYFLDHYANDTLPEDKAKAVQALGMLGDKKTLEAALDSIFTDKIRLQDTSLIASGAMGNPISKEVALPWIMVNWKRLMRLYDPSTLKLRVFVRLLGALSDQNSRRKVKRFFGKKENMRDDIRREVMQALERIDANMKFIKANT